MACGAFWARSPNHLEVKTSTRGPNLTIKRKPSIRVMSWVTFIIDWHVLMTWLNAFYACLRLNTWIWRWARQVQTKIEVCFCDLVMSTSLMFHILDSYTYKSSYTVCIHCFTSMIVPDGFFLSVLWHMVAKILGWPHKKLSQLKGSLLGRPRMVVLRCPSL